MNVIPSLVLSARSFVQSILGIPLTVSPGLLRLYGAKIGERVFAESLSVEEQFASLLTIEAEVVLAHGCHILFHDSSLNNLMGAPVKFGKVIIRQGAYIGARTTILPGVEIGTQALIGAGSLVTKSIPPGQVAYGVPAKVAGSVQELAQRYETRMKEPSSLTFYMNVPPWRERRGIVARLRQGQAYSDFLQKH